jgi:hypothetical protein
VQKNSFNSPRIAMVFLLLGTSDYSGAPKEGPSKARSARGESAIRGGCGISALPPAVI